MGSTTNLGNFIHPELKFDVVFDVAVRLHKIVYNVFFEV